MKNKMIDLNNHLFAQLERLSDEELSPEQLDKEIKRTDAIVDVSKQIIDGATLAFKAAELVAEYGGDFSGMLPTNNGKPVEMIQDKNRLIDGKK
jgi:hypothetical protein